MSFSQLFLLAICELQAEYNLSSEIVDGILKNINIKDHCQFIHDQLIWKQKKLILEYKDYFSANINSITGSIINDNNCGYIIKCFNNGYKKFCNQTSEHHQSEISHQFQKKNINHLIDQKYQNDIYTIYIYHIELICLIINQYIKQNMNL